MTGFYGVSSALWKVLDVTGTVTGNDEYFLSYERDDLTVTVGAGDSFVAMCAGTDEFDPLPGDPAVVSWVVVVESGSAALHFASGMSDRSVISQAACTEDLGTKTVGPGEVVLAQTSFTVDDYLARSSVNLLVECVSGSVVLKQVKLRIWPPDGAGGGWEPVAAGTQPQYAASSGRIKLSGWPGDVTTIGGSGGSAQAAMDVAASNARLALAAQVGNLFTFDQFNSQSELALGMVFGDSDAGSAGSWNANLSLSEKYGYIYADMRFVRAQNPTHCRAPNDVFDEPGSDIRSSVTDPSVPVGTFAGWSGSVRVTSATSQTFESGQPVVANWPGNDGVLHMIPTAAPDDFSLFAFQSHPFAVYDGGTETVIHRSADSTATSVVQDVSLVGAAQCLLILARPAGLTDGAPQLVAHTSDGLSWFTSHRISVTPGPDGLTFLASFPPYERFNPDLVPPPPPPDSLPVPPPPGAILFDTPDLAVVPNDVGVYFATT